jgi:hypothetical protein
MRQRWSDPRSQIGFDLLHGLSETQRLCFATSQGLLENKQFVIELFARVLSRIGTIRCQNGATISVEEFARRLVIPRKVLRGAVDITLESTNSPQPESLL